MMQLITLIYYSVPFTLLEACLLGIGTLKKKETNKPLKKLTRPVGTDLIQLDVDASSR